MMVYTEASTRRAITAWGIEVKKRLLDRNLRQSDLVSELQNNGFPDFRKQYLSNLLYGIGVGARKGEIEFISKYLGIPYSD